LQNLRWLVRAQPFGIVLLAQIDSTAATSDSGAVGFNPIVSIDASARLTFWLVVRDPNFANYTNLFLDAPSNHLYYFSNRSGNQVGDRLFLTQPLPPYQPETEYRVGQLVSYKTSQAVTTLEATRYQSAARPTPQLIDSAELDGSSTRSDSRSGSVTGEWMQLPGGQYVSGADYLPCQGLAHTQMIQQAKPGDSFQFSLVNINQQETFAQRVQIPDRHPPGTPFSVNLNFVGQPPGYYQLRLNDRRIEQFVLFDPIAGRDAFALVEICLNPLVVSPAFRLLNSAGKDLRLQPKTYRIRFKNRATHWRYRCDRPHGFTADTLPTNLQVIDPQTYATKYPIGLYRKPRRLLTDGNNKLLPAPGASMIHPTIESTPDGRKAITAIFSDTYL
jgi:hypothetical protein